MGDIVARIDSLSGTLDDLLMFPRPREPKTAPLAVGPFLADVATWLKQDKSMCDVEVDVDADEALIVADSEQMWLIFTNLLLNAAQAMECRGRIRLSARADGHGCELVVQDSGPGMPEEVRAASVRALLHHEDTRHRPGIADGEAHRRGASRHDCSGVPGVGRHAGAHDAACFESAGVPVVRLALSR
jgi:K+-sensing histidine kinase KdpD